MLQIIILITAASSLVMVLLYLFRIRNSNLSRIKDYYDYEDSVIKKTKLFCEVHDIPFDNRHSSLIRAELRELYYLRYKKEKRNI